MIILILCQCINSLFDMEAKRIGCYDEPNKNVDVLKCHEINKVRLFVQYFGSLNNERFDR